MGRKVGVGAVAGVFGSGELGDEASGAAVDGLTGEGPGESTAAGLHLGDDWVTGGQRAVHAGHVGGEEFGKAGIEKEGFTDGVSGGSRFGLR